MKMLVYFYCITLVALLSSCHEDSPATDDDDGPFRCLVNGQVFLPDAPWGYGSGAYADITAAVDTVGVMIYVTNSTTHQNLRIGFFDIPSPQVGKSYDLSTPKFYVQYIGNKCSYTEVLNGSIKLSKYEMANNKPMIVSGIFEFTASSVECKDTVVVTTGRFDITERL